MELQRSGHESGQSDFFGKKSKNMGLERLCFVLGEEEEHHSLRCLHCNFGVRKRSNGMMREESIVEERGTYIGLASIRTGLTHLTWLIIYFRQ
jgi:hypothetical protein